MAGRVADGGLGQPTTDRLGRARVRMAGSNRLRAPGGAIVLRQRPASGPGSRGGRVPPTDPWTRASARSGPRTTSNAFEGLTMQQSNSLRTMARRAGLVAGNRPEQMQAGAREMRARLDAGEAQGTGALRNYTPRTSVRLPGR